MRQWLPLPAMCMEIDGAIVMTNKKLRWIVAGLMAVSVASIVPGRALAEEKKDKEENEVKVTMDQLPAAVKATLMKEAGDGKISDIDKESEKGKTIYEADVKIGANNYEIKIAEDGTLLSKKLDNEEDEKGSKGKKDEKDEKK